MFHSTPYVQDACTLCSFGVVSAVLIAVGIGRMGPLVKVAEV